MCGRRPGERVVRGGDGVEVQGQAGRRRERQGVFSARFVGPLLMYRQAPAAAGAERLEGKIIFAAFVDMICQCKLALLSHVREQLVVVRRHAEERSCLVLHVQFLKRSAG